MLFFATASLRRCGRKHGKNGRGQFDPRDFIMQNDGNLGLYDTSGQPHWASKTQGNPGAFLNMQDDGNLVVYRAGSASQTADNALWNAGTSVPPPLTLHTAVDSGAMLNAGDANLPKNSYNMLFTPGAGLGACLSRPTPSRASMPVTARPGCGGNTVTVNAPHPPQTGKRPPPAGTCCSCRTPSPAPSAPSCRP